MPSSAAPLRVVVVDDEAPARVRLEDLLAQRPDATLVASCDSGQAAVEVLRGQPVDVVFLDVQMPEMTGFDVVQAVGAAAMPATVFVTAYDRYALRAFDVHAVDYLLKPYADARFAAAFERAASLARAASGASTPEATPGALLQRLDALLGDLARPAPEATPAPPRLDRFVLKTATRTLLLDAARVAWIEGAGAYVVLHADGHRYLYRGLLGHVAARLDPHRFVRVHKSAVVNLEFVRELLPDSHGEFTLVLHDGARVRLSRTYRPDLEARLGQSL